MQPNIAQLSIQGLFGLYDHSVDLRGDESPITIVAGPNGIGKTTLLRLCTALLQGSYRELTRHTFSQLEVQSRTGVRLTAKPIEPPDDEDVSEVLLQQRRRGSRKVDEQLLTVPQLSVLDVPLPTWIDQHGPDVFIDTRDGELLTTEEVLGRYARPGRKMPATEAAEPPEWYDRALWRVDFIETKRLDTLMTAPRRARRRESGQAPIDRYLEAVADTLERARRESARINQASTRSVARRLLTEYSRKTVKPDALRARYARVGERASVLTTNGLLSDSLEVLPEGKLNPTEKRFLELFLDDFEAKLKPLDPVSDKLDQLRAIIDPKFLKKKLAVDATRGITFHTEPDGHEIHAQSLSSGEQHQLALISRLLFNETPGTTVLIDEPELSLHVGWQHQMLEDLEEIAAVAGLAFVLATHSTAIINGRWDLVEELGPLDGESDGEASRRRAKTTT